MAESAVRAGAPEIACVAVGGALGAALRYGTSQVLGGTAGSFPVDTFAVNTLGCLLMGALVVVTTRRVRNRLVRPLLGTGFLGGFTTFSTYELDLHDLVVGGHTLVAVTYLVLTPLAALVAVWLGDAAARRVTGAP